MPRRHSLRYPSFRNLRLYHEVAYQRRTQADVAREYGMSQRRVSQIGQQIRAWIDAFVPKRHFAADDGRRLHLAIVHERLRLQDAYEPILAMFTGDDGDPRFVRSYVVVVDGEVLPTLEVSDKPDFRLLSKAADVQNRLAQLEAIARLGPFYDLPSEYRQFIMHTYHPSDTPGSSNMDTFSRDSGGDSALEAAGGSASAVLEEAPASSNAAAKRTRGVLSFPEALAAARASNPCAGDASVDPSPSPARPNP